jgi:hypothetical protein
MNLEILIPDIVRVISKYLCYIDAIAWKYTCRYFYRCVRINFKQIFIDKINRSGYDISGQDFCDALCKTSSVVSGGFITACLYDLDSYFDIDVYCTDGFIDIIQDDWKYLDQDGDARNFLKPDDGNKRINTIPVNGCIYDFIKKLFDNSVNKLAFNGDKLYVYGWNAKFNRASIIKPPFLYIAFLYGKSEPNSLNQCKDITESRIIKYGERGIKLMKHPEYTKIYNRLSGMSKRISDITNAGVAKRRKNQMENYYFHI